MILGLFFVLIPMAHFIPFEPLEKNPSESLKEWQTLAHARRAVVRPLQRIMNAQNIKVLGDGGGDQPRRIRWMALLLPGTRR